MDDFEFPSSNEWNVPDLLPSQQPVGLAHPFRCWGSTAAKRHHNRGGWHFYTDDYRFSSLVKKPNKLTATEPIQATELNLTIAPETPRFKAIELVGQKRRAARYWQAYGVDIFVDLNVPERHQDLNLLGVPRGWKAYSTRGYDKAVESLASELNLAKAHAGTDGVVFLVVGGGKQVDQWCRENRVLHAGYTGARNVHSAASRAMKATAL